MVDDIFSFMRNTITRHILCMSTSSRHNHVPNNIRDSKSVLLRNSYGETTGRIMENQNYRTSSVVLNVEQFIRDIEERPAIWNRNYHCNKQFMEQTWEELSAIHKLPKTTLKAKWKGLRDNFRVEFKRIPRNENGDFLIPPEAYESKWTHYQSLIFLSEHMRHRQHKTVDVDYCLHQRKNDSTNINLNEEYEQTLVEPDLTNGLIQLPEDEDEDPVVCTGRGSIPRTAMPLGSIHHNIEAGNNSNDSAIYSSSTINGGHRGSRHSARILNSTASNNGNDVGCSTTANYMTTSRRASSNSCIPSITIKRKRDFDYDGNYEDVKPSMDYLQEDDDYHYLLSLHPYMKQLNPSQKLRLRTKIQKLIFKELYKEDLEESK